MGYNQTKFTDYYYVDETYDESEYIEDDDVLIDDDEEMQDRGRWSRLWIVFLIVMVIIIGAILVVLFTPMLQNLISPAPTYIPPLSTPASQL